LKGIVLEDVPETTLARIRFFHQGLGAHERRLQCAGDEVSAFLAEGGDARPETDSADRIEDARRTTIAQHAVSEAMSYFGRIDGPTLRQRMPMILARAAARARAKQGKPAQVRSGAGYSQVEVISETTPHAGFFVTRQIKLRYPQFGGAMSPRMTREVFVATDAAIVLPYDPGRDRLLLVEQFRMGPFGRGDARPWTLEPVAGRIDSGETPEQAARRECEEEAGLNLIGLEHISSHYCSPGCTTEYFHLYLGLCDLRETEQGAGGLDSENEDIRTHVLSFDQAMALLASGEADNGPLILSLIWLQRERARLRAVA